MPRTRRISIPLLMLLGAAGCATLEPPQTRTFAPLGPQVERALYVTTTDEREAVISALQLAGLTILGDARGAPAVLEVRLGSTRARNDCGAVRNVSFRLSQAGVRIADIKGRGWTGSCNPGILGRMSAELARLFGPAV